MPSRFDCVEMKHKAQQSIRTDLRGLTAEQELAYWQRQRDGLHERIDAARPKPMARSTARPKRRSA